MIRLTPLVIVMIAVGPVQQELEGEILALFPEDASRVEAMPDAEARAN